MWKAKRAGLIFESRHLYTQDGERIRYSITDNKGVTADVSTLAEAWVEIENWDANCRRIIDMAKFPNVHVKLVGEDGNAYAIMGSVSKAMKKAGVSKEDIDAYFKDAMSGDYDHLLQVTLKTVNCS